MTHPANDILETLKRVEAKIDVVCRMLIEINAEFREPVWASPISKLVRFDEPSSFE